MIYSAPGLLLYEKRAFWTGRTGTVLSCNRWQCLIISKRPQTKQAGSPSALVSSGVFGFLCRDYYLKGNRPTHLLPREPKGVVRTLRFSGQALTLAACTLICIFDLGTFYPIKLEAVKHYYSSVFCSLPEFSLIKEQSEKYSEKNYFALSKLLDDRRQFPSYFFYIFTFFWMLVREKGHCWDKWMCALARIAGVDQSPAKMRVSASFPTANAIMEMRSANQRT